jgi:dienelactone hydrolase
MGWSFGGGAVLAALGRHTAADVIFTRTIAYYPYCADVGPWSHSIPVLVLWGDSDTVAPHHLCKSAFETSRARGANITIIDYPGARHAFDVADLPPKMEYRFGTVGYHPQAAAEAWKEVTRFLGSTR